MNDQTAEEYLSALSDVLEKEANEKIRTAMNLFFKLDVTTQKVFLHASGFAGEVTIDTLREHFDTLDLLDSIDMYIDDFRSNMDGEQ